MIAITLARLRMCSVSKGTAIDARATADFAQSLDLLQQGSFREVVLMDLVSVQFIQSRMVAGMSHRDISEEFMQWP